MLTLTEAAAGLQSLVIFRNLLKDSAISRFCALARSGDQELPERVALYAEFVSALYRTTDDFSGYLSDLILSDENPYVIKVGAGIAPPPYLEECLDEELKFLSMLGELTDEQVRGEIGYQGFLARWKNTPCDFVKTFRESLRDIGERGYGIFSEAHMFILKDGDLVPVHHPEPIRPQNLTGYEEERGRVLRNTLALLEGKPAANVLLYGDSGTGKSTCVKAMANEFCSRGLRLIELHKDQLFRIPELIDRLKRNPLKFIFFIDDLSFSEHDGNFSSLKAMLEGSVSAKTQNIVVYATSNRRHLIKETFSEREGDDIHLNDTMEELGSLSDRFGLVVTFLRPNQALYLDIVKSYLQRYGIQVEDAALKKQAEAYALSRGGRSPRIARQFADSLASNGGTHDEITK